MTGRLRQILINRWPELVMIVGLYSGSTILLMHLVSQFQQMETSGDQMPGGISFLLGLGSMSLFLILQMQMWGFLRTVACGSYEAHTPLDLLRTGTPFFWRLFGFQLLFFFAFLFVSSLVVTVLGILLFRQHTINELPLWLQALSVFFGFLILLKPFVLIPTLVLVYEYRLMEAVIKALGIQFFPIPYPLRLAAVGFAFFYALLVYLSPQFEQGVFRWPFYAGEGIINSLLLLLVYLTAILTIQDARAKSSTEENDEEL